MNSWRVCHIPNVPGEPFVAYCNSREEAICFAGHLASYDLFLGDLIESNAQWIEFFDGDEWVEVDDEDEVL